jgi:hypothetical protein
MTEITQADRDAANEAQRNAIMRVGSMHDAFARHRQQSTEALQAEVERLKDQLSVETEPSPYCPICGSCGDEGCCGSKRCMYPDTGIEALRLAVVHYDAALKSSWPYGAKGDAWEHWNEARIILQEAGETFTRPDNV